jgi:hypothetical protein
MLKYDRKMSFINDKNRWLKINQNLSKFGVKKWRYKSTQKLLKNWIFEGGVDGAKIIKNRPRGPGTPKMEFFEILQFSTKAPPLFDPKIDPQNGPYKNAIPHK